MISQPNVKINIGLRILRKREDGFHDLETLFVPYHGIHDTLEIITGEDFSKTSAALFAKYPEDCLAQGISENGKLMITIARAEGVDWNPLNDLCAKAYALLDEAYGLPPVKIFLEKTSPVGAGLGGGSSDCAFTLKMLNELCNLGLSDDTLAGYAAKLGSDCAFFIYNRPMIGRGRGDELTAFDIDLSGYEIQVLAPEGISVSTAQAYKGVVPHEHNEPIEAALHQGVEAWKDILGNDFEEGVFKEHPELAAIRQSLYDAGAVYASMSGSGSAVYGIFRK